MSPARRAHRPSGFTLIELLAVIAIIAILVSLGVGIARGAAHRSAVARAKSELALLALALEDYKRHYGDYPQTGPSAAGSQWVDDTTGPDTASAQARLFNALTGVYGPTDFARRLNGPLLVDVSRLTLERPLDLTMFAVPAGSPPTKRAEANAFLDPWGNRYLYFYKRPGAPAASWTAPSFVLFSAGPDGAATALPAADGVFSGSTQTAGDNADNLYADRLP
jgi:prepilin-type N-terminal cleavage/methylation domain-containing protein